MDNLQRRKINRLQEFDYSQNGAYFVTICTSERQCIFWNNTNNDFEEWLDNAYVGANRVRPSKYELSEYGQIVDSAIMDIPNVYQNINVDKYVIMPNHVHMIISIHGDNKINGRTWFAPTISRIIKQTKGRITKQIGFPVWQKSFYDHIIRNQADYDRVWQYIGGNPMKWTLDEYYTKKERNDKNE